MLETQLSVNFIDNLETLNQFKQFYIENKSNIDIVAFDLETDNVEEVKANIYGIGIAFQEEESFYFVIRNKEGILSESCMESVKLVSEIVKSHKLIGHNIIYDVLVWNNNYKEILDNYIHADTILMKHCIDEEIPFGLKETAVKYLGEWADKAQERLLENIRANGGSTTKTNLEMYKADTNILGEYCCWDVSLTIQLYNLFQNKLEQENLLKFFYEDEVMPLYKEVTINMKRHGFKVDVEYFKKLNKNISEEIEKLENEIMEKLDTTIFEYQDFLLNSLVPRKKTGKFPKVLAKYYGVELTSIARKKIEKLEESEFKRWMLADTATDYPEHSVESQLDIYFEKHPDQNFVFNLRSKHHLKHLFFNILKEQPISTTDKGEPQVDDDFLKSIKTKYDWIPLLQDLNKLEKIRGTYVEGILDRQVDGFIYASLLQFGTTSGRYASRNPNLQNLPRPKDEDTGLSELVLKYNNAIRAGFIAPNGYCLIDADYSALEPCCFAHMSSDTNLKKIFHSGEDMYSAIAKRIFNLNNVSTFKKDDNFLEKLYPEKRQIIKAMALAVTYGAEAYRIGELLGIGREEAQRLIDMYLESYPGLNKYIQQCHYEANNQGAVRTIFGRVRHLPEAKRIFKSYGYNILDSRWAKSKGLTEERRLYKNKLNNSTNFKIQGLAAHIVNRAMLQISREFKKNQIDGIVALQIHDQIISVVNEKQAEKAKDIMRSTMQSIVKLDVPLKAEPVIAHNMKDSH